MENQSGREILHVTTSTATSRVCLLSHPWSVFLALIISCAFRAAASCSAGRNDRLVQLLALDLPSEKVAKKELTDNITWLQCIVPRPHTLSMDGALPLSLLHVALACFFPALLQRKLFKKQSSPNPGHGTSACFL